MAACIIKFCTSHGLAARFLNCLDAACTAHPNMPHLISTGILLTISNCWDPVFLQHNPDSCVPGMSSQHCPSGLVTITSASQSHGLGLFPHQWGRFLRLAWSLRLTLPKLGTRNGPEIQWPDIDHITKQVLIGL